MKKIGSREQFGKTGSWKPILNKLGKLENFFEKLGTWNLNFKSWWGRRPRNSEVGVNYGDMREVKKKINCYFDAKNHSYERSFLY